MPSESFGTHNTLIKWAELCKNLSSGICGQQRPRSDCASVQSDQGLRCPLTESCDIIECINGELMPRSDFAHARMTLNLCILCTFDDTFSLDAPQMSLYADSIDPDQTSRMHTLNRMFNVNLCLK